VPYLILAALCALTLVGAAVRTRPVVAAPR
jgi:hypothetical protein